MSSSIDSADTASERGLPGRLNIRRLRTQVSIELDLPKREDRIDASLIPGIEGLVVGFLKRMVKRSKVTQQDRLVSVADDYIVAWVHSEDVDHFLISLAALLDGGQKEPS